MIFYLPFHGFIVIVKGIIDALPGSEFLNLPADVNTAIGYFGGIAVWFTTLLGTDIADAIWDAFVWVVGFEIAIITVRAVLRVAVLALGMRFARAFLAKNYAGAGEIANP